MIRTLILSLPWRCVALAIFLGSSAGAFASVTLNYQFVSSELPAGTRCLLVASTEDSEFGQAGDLAGVPLAEGSVFGGDNVILAVLTAGELPGFVTGVSGVLTLDYGGALGVGDPLRLYWLPGLDPDATVLPLGGGFVDYRTELPSDGGSIGYALPPDGSTDSLYSISVLLGGDTTFPGAVQSTVATYAHEQDSDGDQMEDLLEFAMGLEVNQSSTARQPLLEYLNGGADLVFRFSLRDDLAVHGLVLSVESSENLAEGNWAPVPMQPGAIPGRWEVVVPVPAGSQARQFFRFKLATP